MLPGPNISVKFFRILGLSFSSSGRRPRARGVFFCQMRCWQIGNGHTGVLLFRNKNTLNIIIPRLGAIWQETPRVFFAAAGDTGAVRKRSEVKMNLTAFLRGVCVGMVAGAGGGYGGAPLPEAQKNRCGQGPMQRVGNTLDSALVTVTSMLH